MFRTGKALHAAKKGSGDDDASNGGNLKSPTEAIVKTTSSLPSEVLPHFQNKAPSSLEKEVIPQKTAIPQMKVIKPQSQSAKYVTIQQVKQAQATGKSGLFSGSRKVVQPVKQAHATGKSGLFSGTGKVVQQVKQAQATGKSGLFSGSEKVVIQQSNDSSKSGLFDSSTQLHPSKKYVPSQIGSQRIVQSTTPSLEGVPPSAYSIPMINTSSDQTPQVTSRGVKSSASYPNPTYASSVQPASGPPVSMATKTASGMKSPLNVSTPSGQAASRHQPVSMAVDTNILCLY